MWFDLGIRREGKESEGLLWHIISPKTEGKVFEFKMKAIKGRLKSPREVVVVARGRNFGSTRRSKILQ